MKISRKHLNLILLQLPDPRLVIAGRIAPTIRIPVFKALQVIHHDRYTMNEKIKDITFEYDPEEMDWVLKHMDL